MIAIYCTHPFQSMGFKTNVIKIQNFDTLLELYVQKLLIFFKTLFLLNKIQFNSRSYGDIYHSTFISNVLIRYEYLRKNSNELIFKKIKLR